MHIGCWSQSRSRVSLREGVSVTAVASAAPGAASFERELSPTWWSTSYFPHDFGFLLLRHLARRRGNCEPAPKSQRTSWEIRLCVRSEENERVLTVRAQTLLSSFVYAFSLMMSAQ